MMNPTAKIALVTAAAAWENVAKYATATAAAYRAYAENPSERNNSLSIMAENSFESALTTARDADDAFASAC